VEWKAREGVLFWLKSRGPQAASELAKRLGVTTVAVRQHIAVLRAEGMVECGDERRTHGRPAQLWRLTAKAAERFPVCYDLLTLGLLQAVRNAFGEDGLRRLIAEWARLQVASYGQRIPDGKPVQEVVAALAAIRRGEGYMAEWRRTRNGMLELVENHCAICAAAEYCPELCAAELELFRKVLGEDVSLERTEHILGGDRRCVYRVSALGS
jgi:predicted ArsR family transcriptional regulator